MSKITKETMGIEALNLGLALLGKIQIKNVKTKTVSRLIDSMETEFKNQPKGFVKHFEDSADQNTLGGLSWKQILKMNRTTFNKAFNKIGITYEEGEFNQIRDGKPEFQGKLYCRVKTSYKKRTFYCRNDELVESLIKTYLNNQELALAE